MSVNPSDEEDQEEHNQDKQEGPHTEEDENRRAVERLVLPCVQFFGLVEGVLCVKAALKFW